MKKASESFLAQINRTVNRWNVGQTGALVEDPFTMVVINKPGDPVFHLVIGNKAVLSGKLDEVLTEADRIQGLTKEKREALVDKSPESIVK